MTNINKGIPTPNPTPNPIDDLCDCFCPDFGGWGPGRFAELSHIFYLKKLDL